MAAKSEMSKEPRRKQADRRAEAEERLISSAIELIARRGVDGLRLSELGEIAGVSRSLPAHYFGHKENLIQVIVRRIIDNHYLNTSREASDAPGVGHAVALVEAYVRAMRAHQSNIVALYSIFGSAATNQDILPIVQSLNEESTRRVEAALNTGVDIGEVSSTADTRLEAQSLLAFVRGLGSLHIVDRELPIEKMAAEYLEAMRERIAPA